MVAINVCLSRGEESTTQVDDLVLLFATIFSPSPMFYDFTELIYRLKSLVSSPVKETSMALAEMKNHTES